jgi:phosphohistidine phosphatase
VRLLIVRHAKAAAGEPDELRPLTEDGRETARALGKQLAAAGIRPDAIVTSPLLRARETADEIAKAVGAEAQAEPDERLAPGATPDEVLAAAGGRGETVLVVGHQPDCGRAASALGGVPEPPFPPGGMAVVQLAD